MTASAQRRRRATAIAAGVALAAMATVAGVSVLAAVTLADSRAGRDVSSSVDRVEVALPDTPTALMIVLDDEGRPASMTALVLDPAGRGGSIVPIPMSAAEATVTPALEIEDVLPLAETWELLGPGEFALHAEGLLRTTFDVIEVVDAVRVERLLADLGTLEVTVPDAADLPVDIAERLGLQPGDVVVLTPGEIAQVLSEPPGGSPDRALSPLRQAVWESIAERAGPGVVVPAEGDGQPSTLDAVVEHLLAGAVGVRGLSARLPTPAENPRGVDAVLLDGAEVLLVFAQLAPSDVSAPNPSFNFRVESTFSPEQLAPYGVNNADIAREVIEVLLFLQSNVVSVRTSEEGAPETTTGLVADASSVESLDETWPLVFGPIEVEAVDEVISRVDVTVVLGMDYLEFREQRLGEGAD